MTQSPWQPQPVAPATRRSNNPWLTVVLALGFSFLLGLVLLVAGVLALVVFGGTSHDDLRQMRQDDLGELRGYELVKEEDHGSGNCMPLCANVRATYQVDGLAGDIDRYLPEKLRAAGYTKQDSDYQDNLWTKDGIAVSWKHNLYQQTLEITYDAGG